MTATTLPLRRLFKQSCIWEGGGGVKMIRLYAGHLQYYTFKSATTALNKETAKITASVQTLNDSVHKQFIQVNTIKKKKLDFNYKRLQMFVALASVQQR